MTDGQRAYPVDYAFLHHSTGPEFKNASDMEVQDWYSAIGRDRGYNGGNINSKHEHPSRPGELTYAMAHATLREYTLDDNKYGWRLTDLIKNPYANVAWAVGNWFYNTRSWSVEICGNFMNKVLPDKALMCLADHLRIIDKELVAGGYPGGINVWLHQEVFATACPGRIKEQRDKVVDMINNPDKWNDILWPKDKVEVKHEEITEKIPFLTDSQKYSSIPEGESIVLLEGRDGTLKKVYEVTYVNGLEKSRKLVNEVIEDHGQVKVVAVGTKKPDTGFTDSDRNVLQSILEIVTKIWDAIKAIFKV